MYVRTPSSVDDETDRLLGVVWFHSLPVEWTVPVVAGGLVPLVEQKKRIQTKKSFPFSFLSFFLSDFSLFGFLTSLILVITVRTLIFVRLALGQCRWPRLASVQELKFACIPSPRLIFFSRCVSRAMASFPGGSVSCFSFDSFFVRLGTSIFRHTE